MRQPEGGSILYPHRWSLFLSRVVGGKQANKGPPFIQALSARRSDVCTHRSGQIYLLREHTASKYAFLAEPLRDQLLLERDAPSAFVVQSKTQQRNHSCIPLFGVVKIRAVSTFTPRELPLPRTLVDGRSVLTSLLLSTLGVGVECFRLSASTMAQNIV